MERKKEERRLFIGALLAERNRLTYGVATTRKNWVVLVAGVFVYEVDAPLASTVAFVAQLPVLNVARDWT